MVMEAIYRQFWLIEGARPGLSYHESPFFTQVLSQLDKM